LDIFFTHSYQYILEEETGSVAGRLATLLAGTGGSLLAENSFRLGHPWGLSIRGWFEGQLAYLSGTFDAMTPLVLPPGVAGEGPAYQPRTLIDIRIRPNLFLVVIAYAASVFLCLDVLGIELFWRSRYLLRLALLCVLALGSVWLILTSVAQVRRRFEVLLIPAPPGTRP
jgi:hypothetical protein